VTPTPTPTPQPPGILKQPTDRNINLGQSAIFSVTANGTLPLSYQWTKNGTDISGANKAGYHTPPVTAEDNGSLFAVTITNVAGNITSNSAKLTVNLPPTITAQPKNTTVTTGQPARFTVTAAGKTPFSYQWMKNSVQISGATGRSYTTPPTTPGDNGAIFSVTVSNTVGNTTSNGAILTVQ
jgi:hypothetical protein